MDEIEDLMRRARRRVLHLLAIVAAILAAISSRIEVPSPAPPIVIMRISVWGIGCLGILALGVLWYEARAAATWRLPRLLQAGKARLASIEQTPIALEILPFGIEVDVMLESGERLAFGFWTSHSADRLVEIVSERLPRVEPKGVSGDER